jgi:hypothetical protein
MLRRLTSRQAEAQPPQFFDIFNFRNAGSSRHASGDVMIRSRQPARDPASMRLSSQKHSFASPYLEVLEASSMNLSQNADLHTVHEEVTNPLFPSSHELGSVEGVPGGLSRPPRGFFPSSHELGSVEGHFRALCANVVQLFPSSHELGSVEGTWAIRSSRWRNCFPSSHELGSVEGRLWARSASRCSATFPSSHELGSVEGRTDPRRREALAVLSEFSRTRLR